MLFINLEIRSSRMIQMKLYFLVKIIFCSILFSHATEIHAADLLFGKSKDDPSCIGNIWTNHLFSESISYTKSIKSGGTALNPDFSFIDDVWPQVITQATRAAISLNESDLNIVYMQLDKLAKNNVALSTPTKAETKNIICYSGGPNKPCIKHAPMMAARYFSYYAYTAFLIKDYIEKQADAQIIKNYVKNGYQKYTQPFIEPNDPGIFQLLDGYIGKYSYAKLLDNNTIADEALREGIKKIKIQLRPDGNITFSSFRGVRSYFYHSLAVDVILSFGELAENAGLKFYSDHDLKQRIGKSIELLIKYAPDPKAFEAKGYYIAPDGLKAYSTDEKDALRYIIRQALALDVIIRYRYPELVNEEVMEKYFPIAVNPDYVSQGGAGNFIDMAAGFVPRCLQIAPERSN